jgi:methyl-accepting chemotaxis protein
MKRYGFHWRLRYPRSFSLSLAMKMSIGFAIVLLIFAAVSIFNHLRLEVLEKKDVEVRMLSERKQTAIALKSLVEQMDATASGFMLSGKSDLASQYKESIPEFAKLTEAVGSSAEMKEQRNWRARLKMVSTEFTDNFERAEKQANDPAVDAARKQSMMVATYNASQIHKQVMYELVQSFYDAYSAEDQEAKRQFGELIQGTRTVTLWATIAAIAFAIAVAAFVVRSLTLGIRQLRFGIERVQGGDLSESIAAETGDELGRLSDSFDASVAAVRGMLKTTKSIVESLTAHSDRFRQFAGSTKETNTHIVRAMGEIAVGATKQAEQTEASAAAIGELEERMDGIFTATEILIASSRNAKRSVESGTLGVKALSESSERTGEAA